jgi:predicted peptidase
MSKEQVPGTQLGYSFESKGRLPYLLFLPEGYGKEPDRKWPLILSLHGAGERGDDLDVLRDYGPAKEAEKNPEFPFICVSPQCPDNELWLGLLEELKSLLDQVVSTYSVDQDRVYLTGFSLGGFGAWAMAKIYPDSFAAMAPICGGGTVDGIDKMKDIPVWAFHGEEDEAVPVEMSRIIVKALQEAGGQAKLTVYPGVGHDSWSQTYENPELYEWMLHHRRNASTK